MYDDALAQIYLLEKKVYREVERKYFKNKKPCNHSFEGDVATDFYTEAQKHLEQMNLFVDLVSKYVQAMRTMAENAKKREAEAQAVVSNKNY